MSSRKDEMSSRKPQNTGHDIQCSQNVSQTLQQLSSAPLPKMHLLNMSDNVNQWYFNVLLYQFLLDNDNYIDDIDFFYIFCIDQNYFT